MRRILTWPAGLLVCVAAGLLPDPGTAAIVKLSVAQLAAEADTVVVGIVVGQTSAWNAQHTMIYTHVTVSVEEVLKGSPGHEVTFQVMGGAVGGLGVQTSVDPTFTIGERAVLFLNTTTAPATLTGLRQGKSVVREGRVRREGRTQPVGEFLDSVRATLGK